MSKWIWITLLAICLPAAAVVVAWDNSHGATGYRLYYGTVSHIYSWSVESSGPQANVTNLIPGTTYYFSATAYNEFGESGFSDELSYVVPAEKAILSIDQSDDPAGPWTNRVTLTNVMSGVAGFWRVTLTRTN